MTTERWRQIEEIYQSAADLALDERAGFLDQACTSDQELRRAVEDLLCINANVDAPIEAAIQSEAERLAARTTESVIGESIGAYRVTGVVGAGGMGTVYRAVRDDDQYQKEVAIKVVKRGMDFDAVLSRFRRERRILARLEHPYIARLIDGGVTAAGLPYFVMEYVEGAPLTEYCAGKPLDERLHLFRQVCAAVQYAHQNLIVHRDLKPGNILVTRDGVPKLLDFGLAKLLDPEQPAEHTLTMIRMLTPDYASPEQVRGENITTASDIYSLGAVLYELVSGRHAHQFQNRTTAEMDRVICQKDPPPLEGELGNIAQMAMHKESPRRYATVEQFSDDVRRYLDGLPVLARKDTMIYRARKFVRRNKVVVGVTVFAWVALGIGIGVAAWQAQRARRHLDDVAKLADTMLFEVSAQIAQIPGTRAARETLITTGLTYFNRVARRASDDSSLQLKVATGYENMGALQFALATPSLGDRNAAQQSYQKAREIEERLFRRDPKNAELLARLVDVYLRIGQTSDNPFSSLDWYRKALDANESLKLARPAKPGSVGRNNLPEDLCLYPGRTRLTLRDFSGALAAVEKCGSAPVNDIRAAALAGMGDLAHALEMARAAVAGSPLAPEFQYSRQIALSRFYTRLGNLSGNPLALNLGDPKAAVSYYEEALKLAEDLNKRDQGPYAAGVLAEVHASLGAIRRETQPLDAVSHYERALEIREKAVNANPTEKFHLLFPARYHAEIALPLRRLGKRQLAFINLRKAIALEETETSLPTDDVFVRAMTARSESERPRGPAAFTLNETGDLLLETQDRPGALQYYQRALSVAEREVSMRPHDMPARRDLADCYERLGAYYAAVRDWRQAHDWYLKSLAVWREWTTWGISSVYDQRRAREAARAAAKYGRLLSANSPE